LATTVCSQSLTPPGPSVPADESKGGKPVPFPGKSLVVDPTKIPSVEEMKNMGIQTAWRPDKLKEMTYTQFWSLVKERQIEKVIIIFFFMVGSALA
jgi:hypothetical protein